MRKANACVRVITATPIKLTTDIAQFAWIPQKPGKKV